MKIYNSNDGLFKNTYYIYNMSGWIAQYGTPLQLSLTMHLCSMAPDFALEIAKNAVENTEIEIGLVEIPDVDITLKFMIDTDNDGTPEEYHLEKKLDINRHMTEDEEEEDGYDSDEEANSGEQSDSERVGEGDEVEDQYNNLNEALAAYKEKMDEITDNGANKQVAGGLVYTDEEGTYSLGGMDFINIYYDESYKDGYIADGHEVDSYYIACTNEYIMELQDILLTYKNEWDSEPLAQNEDGFKLNEDNENIRNIVEKYFKLENVEETMFNHFFESLAYHQYAVNTPISWDSFTSTSTHSDGLYEKEGTFSDGTRYKYSVFAWPDGQGMYEYFSDPATDGSDGWYVRTDYQRGVYYRANMRSWYDIIFLGKKPEVRTTWVEDFIDWVSEHFPIRLYYRLIDESGNALNLKELNGGSYLTGSDYFYTTGSHSYWKEGQEDGWFWRKSIPKKLYNAVKCAIDKHEFDEEQEIRAQERERDRAEREEEREREREEARERGEEDPGPLPDDPEETPEEFNYEYITDPGLATEPTPQEVQDIFDKAFGDLGLNINGVNTRGLHKYFPIVLKVVDHWFEELYYDEPCYKWEDSAEGTVTDRYLYYSDDSDYDGVKLASEAEILYIEEKAPGKIVQQREPRKEKEREFLNALINGGEYTDHKGVIHSYDGEYWIYDGRGKSKQKKKIDFSNNSGVDAIAMLEQVQGEDAQQIIRMFKIFMKMNGVEFKDTDETKYKWDVCGRVLDKEESAFDARENLLTDDEVTLRLSVDLPPTQHGFQTSVYHDGDDGPTPVSVRSPVKGKVSYRSDDSICITIEDDEYSGKYNDWTIMICGFKVGQDLEVGKSVTKNEKIGIVKKRDLVMNMRDAEGALVKDKHTSETVKEAKDIYDEHKGDVTTAKNGRRNAGDIEWVVQTCDLISQPEKERIGNANGEFIKALIDMQEYYGIDPLWALAVAHGESSCGTCEGDASHHILFNISKWSGTEGENGLWKNKFVTFVSDRAAILDFGKYACYNFSQKLTTVDDFEEFADQKPFENAKKKYYPYYLQLKTVLSSKGV
ncbi:MAG: hypothetical protein J6I85_07985 [Clostridia bacterium]|nr:hypothetical protein [Clostridia bacterium]